MELALTKWAAAAERAQHAFKRTLDPLAAEIVSARFMRLLGIGAPETIRELAGDETPDDTWITKSMRAGRMRRADDGPSVRRMAIQRIPGTISLSALRLYYNVNACQRRWDIPVESLAATVLSGLVYQSTGTMPGRLVTSDILIENVMQFLSTGSDPLPRAFFSDFVAPADWTTIRETISQESQQMLDIHAARAFLACTTAHAGNVLVDCEAKLYSIDHEHCVVSDPREVQLLGRHVRRGTKARKALQRIAELEEHEIRGLFEDLPDVEWPMGDRATTVAHFTDRLNCWRAAFCVNRSG